MIKTKILAVLALLAVSSAVSADNGQVVTVNGNTVAKTVTKMTFEGDNVVLYYADQSTETVDMGSVVIVFTVADAIKALSGEPADAPVSYYDLNGRQLKQTPLKGGYIMRKGNTMVKLIKK